MDPVSQNCQNVGCEFDWKIAGFGSLNVKYSTNERPEVEGCCHVDNLVRKN